MDPEETMSIGCVEFVRTRRLRYSTIGMPTIHMKRMIPERRRWGDTRRDMVR
jgi:hypothetical protein